MWAKSEIAKLNKFSQPCGSCAFCGHKDKRHRLWDTWLSLSMGGESELFISRIYDIDIEYVKLVLAIKPYHKN